MLEDEKIAVVVPAYCEEELLPKTVETMPEWVDRVVIVDDGSPDETFEVARRCADGDERMVLVRLGFNYGVGKAIGAGYERALELGADVVAVMAADAQMDPRDLDDVVRPVAEGRADYSKGDRTGHRDLGRMPVVRRLGTQVLALLTGAVVGRPEIRDSQCGYTAISAPMIEKLPLDKLYPRYGYPNDLLLRLAERDAEIAQPVVRPVYADEDSGLVVGAVVKSITGILVRGLMRRMIGGVQRAVKWWS